MDVATAAGGGVPGPVCHGLLEGEARLAEAGQAEGQLW